MTTANYQILNNMVAAPWVWLNTKTDYTALGLTEFRLYDGRAFPTNDQGHIGADVLPCLRCRSIKPGRDDPDTTPESDTVILTLELQVIFADESGIGVASSIKTLEALMTIADIFGNWQAIRTNLGQPTAIDGFKFTLGDVTEIPSRDAPELIDYWIGDATLELEKKRPIPQE